MYELAFMFYLWLPEYPEDVVGRYIYRAPVENVDEWEWAGFVLDERRYDLSPDAEGYCWKYADVYELSSGEWIEELSPVDVGCQERAGCHQ